MEFRKTNKKQLSQCETQRRYQTLASNWFDLREMWRCCNKKRRRTCNNNSGDDEQCDDDGSQEEEEEEEEEKLIISHLSLIWQSCDWHRWRLLPTCYYSPFQLEWSKRKKTPTQSNETVALNPLHQVVSSEHVRLDSFQRWGWMFETKQLVSMNQLLGC